APSRAVGFARSGQEVRLLYDSFPFEQFGGFKGRIASVTRTAIDPREVDDPIKLDEPVYKIEVELESQEVMAYGAMQPLEPGMTLTANLVLERRSFFSWLTEPLREVVRRN